MFRPSCLNLQQPARTAPFTGFKPARPNADSFSKKNHPKIPHRTSPDADNSSFSFTPHS